MIQRFENDLQSTINKIKTDFQQSKSHDEICDKVNNFNSTINNTLQSLQESLSQGRFSKTNNLKESSKLISYIDEVFQNIHPILESTNFQNQEFYKSLVHLDSLLTRYKSSIETHNYEIINNRLEQMQTNIADAVHEIVNTEQEIKQFTPYIPSHCYGRMDENREGHSIQNHPTMESLPTIPSLPTLWLFSGSSSYIKRMNLICDSLKNVLSWQYKRTEKLSELSFYHQFSEREKSPNLSEDGFVIIEPKPEVSDLEESDFKALAFSPPVPETLQALSNLYESLDEFQNYLKNPINVIERSYLSQAEDVEERASKFFHHQLELHDQELLNPFFQKFREECQLFHKQFNH